MRLIPRKMETNPRIVTSSLALILTSLIYLAHPHERGWELASDFLLGFALALVIADIVLSRKPRPKD